MEFNSTTHSSTKSYMTEIHPPKWPVKLLRFFLKKEYVEEIEGDMEEIFYDNAEVLSLSKAKRIYTWEMLKLLRPALLRNFKHVTFNPFVMYKNYLKIALRNLTNQKFLFRSIMPSRPQM